MRSVLIGATRGRDKCKNTVLLETQTQCESVRECSADMVTDDTSARVEHVTGVLHSLTSSGWSVVFLFFSLFIFFFTPGRREEGGLSLEEEAGLSPPSPKPKLISGILQYRRYGRF